MRYGGVCSLVGLVLCNNDDVHAIIKGKESKRDLHAGQKGVCHY